MRSSQVGERERITQQRVIDFFQLALEYRYLGNWERRDGNSNVEPEILRSWLKEQGGTDKVIEKALRELDRAKTIVGGRR